MKPRQKGNNRIPTLTKIKINVTGHKGDNRRPTTIKKNNVVFQSLNKKCNNRFPSIKKKVDVRISSIRKQDEEKSLPGSNEDIESTSLKIIGYIRIPSTNCTDDERVPALENVYALE